MVGGGSPGAAGEVAGIVLDAVAAARGGQHLDVILHALFDALGLQQFPVLRGSARWWISAPP
jgi:hypothetical protein